MIKIKREEKNENWTRVLDYPKKLGKRVPKRIISQLKTYYKKKGVWFGFFQEVVIEDEKYFQFIFGINNKITTTNNKARNERVELQTYVGGGILTFC